MAKKEKEVNRQRERERGGGERERKRQKTNLLQVKQTKKNAFKESKTQKE